MSRNNIPRTKPEAADLTWRDIDVVGTREVIIVRGSQKTEAVRQSLKHPLSVDVSIFLGLGLKDGKDQLLPAHISRTFNTEVLSNKRQLGDFFALKGGQV